jgi:hypothetical protein
MNDRLEQKLSELHNQNQPNPQFADQLEGQLTGMTIQTTPKKPFYLGTIARPIAATLTLFALVSVIVMTVEPFRNLAQDLIRFFVETPANNYVLGGDEDAFMDTVSVSTIEEAEAIAGFDALEWVEGGFHILNISAGEGYISIAYERENDRGVLMHVSKWLTDTRPEQHPIPSDTPITPITVNGVDGQFVMGYWYQEAENDVLWYNEHYRQLRWQDDGLSYHLLVSSPIARTAEQTVRVAETLR